MGRPTGKHFEVEAPRSYKDIMREAGMHVVKGTLSVALVASLVPTVPVVAYAELEDETTPDIVVDDQREGTTEETNQILADSPATADDPVMSMAESAAASINVYQGTSAEGTLLSASDNTEYTNVQDLYVEVSNVSDGNVVSVTSPSGQSLNPDDNENPTSYSGSITLTEGKNTIEIVVKESNEETAKVIASWNQTIVYDKDVPTAALDEGSDKPLFSSIYSERTVKVTFTDANDISNVVVKDADGNQINGVTVDGKVATIHFTEEGAYSSIKVSAEDVCGNKLEDQELSFSSEFSIASVTFSVATNPAYKQQEDDGSSKLYFGGYGDGVVLNINIPATVGFDGESAPTTITGKYELANGNNDSWSTSVAWEKQDDDSWVGSATLADAGQYSDLEAKLSNDASSGSLTIADTIIIDKGIPTVESAIVSRDVADTNILTDDTADPATHTYLYNEQNEQITVTLSVQDDYGLSRVELWQGSSNRFQLENSEVEEGAKTGTAVITLSNDGDRLDRGALIVVTDLAGNKRIWSINADGEVYSGDTLISEEEGVSTSNTVLSTDGKTYDYSIEALVLDTVDPVITLADPTGGAKKAANGIWYADGRSAVQIPVSIVEGNFDLTQKFVANAEIVTVTRESDSEVVATLYASDFSGEESNWSSTFSIPASALQDESGTLVSGTYTVSAGFTDIGGNKSNEPSLSFVVDASAPIVKSVQVNHEPSYVDEDGRQYYQQGTRLTITIEDDNALAAVTATQGNEAAHGWLYDPDGTYSTQFSPDGKTATITVQLEDGAGANAHKLTEFERNVILTAADTAGNVRTWSISDRGTVTEGGSNSKGASNTPINGKPNNYPSALVQDTIAPTTSLAGVTAGTYYNSTQYVTGSLSEYNFSYLRTYEGSTPVMHITKYEGNAGRAVSNYSISASSFEGADPDWSHREAFDSDGHYVVEMSFEDIAGNASQVSRIEEFTIDKTAPVVTVDFDNNDVQNGKYYKAARTATVTVVEHNFDPTLIEITTEGAVGGWADAGDTHTLRITYATDGDYTLTINGKDLAGNAFATYTAEPFTIDLTAPTITFSGVEDAHAYGGDVMPVIIFEDEKNFDANGCQWTLTGYNVSSETGASYSQSTALSGNGQTVSFANFPNEIGVDDIYTLEANLTDLAGNTAQGSITFSVNRFGSNFMVVDADEYTTDTNRGVMSQPPTVQVVEVNVSGVASGESQVVVSRGLKTENLEEHETAESTGYVVDSDTDEGSGWSRYVYTVASGNFEEEGDYSVIVRSSDAAGNESKSSEYFEHFEQDAGAEKNATVNFVIDKTAPLIEGLSISDSEVYEENGHDVTFSVVDNVGYESADVKVLLSGKKGTEEVELSHSNDGSYSFHVDESSFDPRTVEISVADWAGNEADVTVSNFRVTTSVFELHLPVILGSAAVVGGGALGGAAWWRKRKSDESESPTIR